MSLHQDLRYAARMIARKPSFAALVILVLAIGLGANTAIFSLVEGVLLRPLPYREPARLVLVSRADRNQTGDAFSMALLHTVRERAAAIDDLAGFQYQSFNLVDAGEPERLQGMVVTANLFATLGVEPQLGRTFLRGEDEPGRPHVAVISHGLWSRRFASDPRVVGRSIQLSGQSYRIVGIMPESFRFDRGEGLPGGFDFSPRTELWAPLQVPVSDTRNYLIAVARLHRGLTVSQAEAQMDIVARQIERARSDAPRGLRLPLARLDDELVRPLRTPLLILWGAVGLLLLIACANAANLLLSRAAARRAEFSIRVSLGAGHARLARQLITESLVYSLAAGAVGLLLAWAALNFCLHSYPSGIPRTHNPGLNWPSAIFSLALALATGLSFGLAPLITTLRMDLYTTIKKGRGSGGGREGRAVRQWLIGAEVALAFVLLAGAGLLVRSFINVLAVDPGFHPDRVLTAQIDLPETRYPDGLKMVAFFRRVLDGLKTRPEVQAAGLVTILPMGGLDRDGPGFTIVGRSDTENNNILPSVTMPLVSPGYFQAMGIPLRQGRYFTDADNESAPGAAIVNEVCARRWFSHGDAVGQQLSALRGVVRFTIVGVVADVRHWGLEAAPQPMIYAPYVQVPRRVMAVLIHPMTLVVHAAGPVASLTAPIRAAVHAADPEQPMPNLQAMTEVLARSLAERRLLLAIMTGFGVTALLLAVVGIYAVVSYSVGQRSSEIGIRMALGARPGIVAGMILRQGMGPALAGLAAGLVISLATTRVLGGLLFGVQPTDIATFAGIMCLLALGTAFASYQPARKAARIDPMVALRHE